MDKIIQLFKNNSDKIYKGIVAASVVVSSFCAGFIFCKTNYGKDF